MAKIIGAILGTFILGPFGTLLGFFVGSLIDSRIKFSFSNSFFNEHNNNNLLINSLPMLAAEIALTSGIKKTLVLTVKNIFVQLYGTNTASQMMTQFKRFIDSGMPRYHLEEVYENLYYGLDHQTKIYLISTLFTIVKASGTFNSEEILTIKNISTKIGINSFEFQSILQHFKMEYNNYSSYNNFYTQQKENPYKTLGITPEASIDQIKKQYRTLCKKYHPDVTSQLSSQEQEESEEKMKKIIDAYEEIKKSKNFK